MPAPSIRIQPTPTPRRLQISKAQRSDAQQVADVVRSSASWYQPILSAADMREHSVDELWALRNFKMRDFYVGRAENKVAGIVSLQYTGPYAYMGYLYLNANIVGKGYGAELFEYARAICRERGRKAMMLIAHPKATWAMKAYAKWGFRVIARDREDVLGWHDGWLKPYYEEGFVLHQLDL